MPWLLLALGAAIGLAVLGRRHGAASRRAAPFTLPSYLTGRKVSRSHEDAEGWVVESPEELARQMGGVSVEDATLARFLASERASGTPLEKASIAHAIVNEMRDRNRRQVGGHPWNLRAMATYVRGEESNRYGRQYHGRYAATQEDPTDKDLYIATMVLHGGWPDPTGGADQFLDPYWQRRLHAQNPSRWESVEDKLAEWTEGGRKEVYVVPGTNADRLVFVRPVRA